MSPVDTAEASAGCVAEGAAGLKPVGADDCKLRASSYGTAGGEGGARLCGCPRAAATMATGGGGGDVEARREAAASLVAPLCHAFAPPPARSAFSRFTSASISAFSRAAAATSARIVFALCSAAAAC